MRKVHLTIYVYYNKPIVYPYQLAALPLQTVAFFFFLFRSKYVTTNHKPGLSSFYLVCLNVEMEAMAVTTPTPAPMCINKGHRHALDYRGWWLWGRRKAEVFKAQIQRRVPQCWNPRLHLSVTPQISTASDTQMVTHRTNSSLQSFKKYVTVMVPGTGPLLKKSVWFQTSWYLLFLWLLCWKYACEVGLGL